MRTLLLLMCSLSIQAFAEVPDISVSGIKAVKKWAQARIKSAAKLETKILSLARFLG